MKREFKGFIVGIIVTLLITNSVLAENLVTSIEVMRNYVTLMVNGKKVEVDNFLYNGTTYVPMRAVAEMLDKEVTWDENTRTANIVDKINQDSVENVTKEIVEVSSTEEFLKAIGSNKKIILKGNIDYYLLDSSFSSEKVYYETVHDGKQLVIEGVENLEIVGQEDIQVQLLVEPRYANVITFRNVKNVKISNIIAGHTPEKGGCTGGVLVFENSSDIMIDDSTLFGCGKEGITLFNVINFTFDNSTIKECSEAIVSIDNSKNVLFRNSKFFDNNGYGLMNIFNSQPVEFDNCEIYNNVSVSEWSPYFFDIDNNTKISINNSKIYDNLAPKFANIEGNIILENVEFRKNLFDSRSGTEVKEYLFKIEEKDIKQAIYLPFTDIMIQNRVDKLNDGETVIKGVDRNGNDSKITRIHEIYCLTPYMYINYISSSNYKYGNTFTFDDAVNQYYSYMYNNELIFVVLTLGDTERDITSIEAEMIQEEKVIKLKAHINTELIDEVKSSDLDVKYGGIIFLKVNIDEIDFSKPAVLKVWANGNEKYVGEYDLDFSTYR